MAKAKKPKKYITTDALQSGACRAIREAAEEIGIPPDDVLWNADTAILAVYLFKQAVIFAYRGQS